MARPTGAALTGEGFALVGSGTTKYAKTTGTATAIVDIGTGAVDTGVAAIAPTTPGVRIALADWNAHVAILASFGISVTGDPRLGPDLVYYGTSV